MNETARTTVRPAPHLGDGTALATADERLAVAESLLRSDDPGACAQRCLDWLKQHAGAERAVCLGVDGDGKRLVGVAALGVSSRRAAELWLDGEEQSHPLVAALRGTEPVRFDRGPGQPRTPLGDEAFCAVPLGARDPEEPALGLLLVPGDRVTRSPNFQWVVAVLSAKFQSLRARQLEARLHEQRKTSSELEQRVQAATAELAQASAARSQFLANMSHELRTPLNAILGYTSMLLQGVFGPLQPPQAKNLGRVDSNARHLLGVINEILDITRIESGRMPLHVGTFELPALVKEVLGELDPIIQRSPAQVITRVERRIPRLRTDRQKVKQILVNLLGNALKFTHEGTIRITATWSQARGEVTIAVKDTGIGIAEENHLEVFEVFRQVDGSTTRARGGTGLGLAICRRLATLLGGRISLKSTVGVGSTFTVRFPGRARRG